MRGHAVALVVLEAVAGIEQSQACHQPVARDLGNNGGRGDRGEDSVAAYHGLAVAADLDAVAAVDEHELRPDRQACDGARERPQRCPQNVVAIDAPWRRDGNRYLGAGTNLSVQLLARFGVELFRIIEPARHALGVEHDRGGNDRTGKRSPARFVAARDRPHPAFDCGALAAEGRADDLFAERQTYNANFLGASGNCARGYRAAHGAMVRAVGFKSTGPRFLLWRMGKRSM